GIRDGEAARDVPGQCDEQSLAVAELVERELYIALGDRQHGTSTLGRIHAPRPTNAWSAVARQQGLDRPSDCVELEIREVGMLNAVGVLQVFSLAKPLEELVKTSLCIPRVLPCVHGRAVHGITRA